MAEFNFGLLTPPGSQSIGNAFVSGMDQAAVARAQENQNALSQYTLSKARREDELTNQMLAGMQGADTIEKQADVLRRGGRYKEANELLTSGLERAYKLGQIQAQPGARAKTAAETQKLTDESRNKAIAEVAGFPDVDSANAAIDARLANKIIDQATADQMRQGLTPETFTQWKHNTLVRLSTPAEQLKQSAVTTKDTDRGGFIERQTYDAQGKAVGAPIMLPKTAAPSTDAAMLSASVRFNPETGAFQNVAPAGMSMRLPAAAGAVPQGFPVSGGVPPTAAPAAVGGNAMIPTAPPSVNAMRPGAAPTAAPAATSGYSPRMLREMAAKGMQPDGKGGQTFIPGGEKDPAVEQQVAKSRAVGAQAGKNDAIAIEKLPNAIATGTELIRKLDALLGDANVVNGKVTFSKQAPADGFENAFGLTGMAARAYPGSAAADFQAKVKEILGGAFLEAYETLRGAQGITDVEGKKATESRTRMGFNLSPAEFIIAAREYRKTAAEALGRSETRLKSLRGSSAAPANRPPLADIMSGNQ